MVVVAGRGQMGDDTSSSAKMDPNGGDARTARDRALVFRVFSSCMWVGAVLESPAAQQETLSSRGKVLNLGPNGGPDGQNHVPLAPRDALLRDRVASAPGTKYTGRKRRSCAP